LPSKPTPPWCWTRATFQQDFTDRLLASFDDLDESTDGLLVHAENWQALNLLQEKYRERVKCIYIDPPYNTGNDEFLYKIITSILAGWHDGGSQLLIYHQVLWSE
jgi:16S rRNA G966 N2-methylase RsmD